MVFRKHAHLALAILVLAGLVGCGGGRNVECCDDEAPCVDMPVGLCDDTQTFVFDKDIGAFVVEDAAHIKRTVALQDQTLEFDWASMDQHDAKAVVYFPYDGRDPRNDQAENLAQVDHIARDISSRNGTIVLAGHSCKWHGTAAYNLAISQDRPQVIKKHLVDDLHIPASRIKTFGLGNEQPIAFEYSKEGQAPNRRVEVYELRA